MAGIPQRIKHNLSLTWRWFSHWRKRYMWLRLLILLLVFAHPIYQVRKPLIRELVVIAIKGIESAKLGPRLYAQAYEFQERKGLQNALRAKFDANRDGALNRAEAAKLRDETGLGRDAVTCSGLDADLDALVEASHKTGVLSRVVTGADIRRRALDAAVAEQEREHRELSRQIAPMLQATRTDAADWLQWETWVGGLDHFRAVLAEEVPGGRQFFAGLAPGSEPFMWSSREYPKWQGYAGWIALLAIAVLSVRRYGTGEALRRRFGEDPELAAAPCPVCGEATHEYGALMQHRISRACATAAVVGLVFVAVAGLGLPRWLYGVGMVAIPAAGAVRWILWPREVHACHRRPSLLYVGFAAALLLVVGLLSGIAAYGMNTLGHPRPHVVAVAGPRRWEAMERRRGASARRRSRDATRARHAATTSRQEPRPTASRTQRRGPRGTVGPDSTRGRRSAGARDRTRHRERIAARRARRAAARQPDPGR